MKITEYFLSQLDAESGLTRRALERVPEGRDDWKPHEKSMPLGRLAGLIARMPSWISLILGRDDFDLKPSGGNFDQTPLRTAAQLVATLDEGSAQARRALASATEEHLSRPWRLLVGGHTVSESPRHVVLRDTFMHLSHHRGQLTVYLRLCGVAVPAIYGPSADDERFS